MLRKILFACIVVIAGLLTGCSHKDNGIVNPPPAAQSLVNTSHLDYLFTPVQFETGNEAAGVYIYAESPDYRLVGDADEGFTCVDDVARAALVYLRSDSFAVNESIRSKAFLLLSFLVEMQATNGYFYNFLLPGDLINKYHVNSVAGKNWWSWRSFQTLAEAAPIVSGEDAALGLRIDDALDKMISNIKSELTIQPVTTKVISGFTVPQWLPLGSASDQAATLLLGLVSYCNQNEDEVLKDYIGTLADGIVMMQQGDGENFPYGCFLSFENHWHAYGNEQAYALLKAGVFLQENNYVDKALEEINGFYPWLIDNGYKSAITFDKNIDTVAVITEQKFDQIAYGITPMVLAAIEAYQITSDEKYADIAGRMAAWYVGANDAGLIIYSKETGRCFDGLLSTSAVNRNSGAESTIEALLCFQQVEKYVSVKSSLDKYRK